MKRLWVICLVIVAFCIGALSGRFWFNWKFHQPLGTPVSANSQQPKFGGRLVQALITDVGHKDAVVLALQMDLWNEVDMPEISLLDYRVTMRINGNEYHGTTACPISESGLVTIIPGLPGNTRMYASFQRATSLEPLRYGTTRREWLLFYVDGLKDDPSVNDAEIDLLFIHLHGGSNAISLGSNKLIRGRLSLGEFTQP